MYEIYNEILKYITSSAYFVTIYIHNTHIIKITKIKSLNDMLLFFEYLCGMIFYHENKKNTHIKVKLIIVTFIKKIHT